jgi:two-component system response regulator DesR
MYALLAGKFQRPPRWELVSRFVSACVQLGKQKRISIPADLASLETWRRHYTHLTVFLEGSVMNPSPPIRVLLAEEMDLLRAALVSLLSSEPDIEVIADLKCDRNAVSAAAMRLQPDVMVVSADPPDSRALTIIHDLSRQLPNCRLIALTQKGSSARLKHLLAADVSGLIDKNAPATRLLHAIRGVAGGGTVIDANLVVAALSAGSNPFTPRETRVLQLAAEGASGPEIAKKLSLSPGTVRNYLSNAMNKTGARSRIDAIQIAIESNWL